MSSGTREKVLVTWLALLTLLCAVLAWNGFATPAAATFEELSVERLNVLEPDGKPRVIIANKARLPGIYLDGTEYPHPTREFGGLVFYNSEGDEIGGLAFDASETEDGYHAAAHLAFDQFKQDQTVTLTYRDANGERTGGLRVDDQPDTPILPLVRMNARIADAESDEEVEAIRREMRAYVQERGMHTERAFFGKLPDGSAVVRLSDGEGRPRLILAVDPAGDPSLRFLDENGEVVSHLPEP